MAIDQVFWNLSIRKTEKILSRQTYSPFTLLKLTRDHNENEPYLIEREFSQQLFKSYAWKPPKTEGILHLTLTSKTSTEKDDNSRYIQENFWKPYSWVTP